MQQARDLREEGEELYKLVRSLDPADWDRSTPFKNWTVNDVIAHLHTTDLVATLAVEDPDRFRAMVRAGERAIWIGGAAANRPHSQGPDSASGGTATGELWDKLAEVDPSMRYRGWHPTWARGYSRTVRQWSLSTVRTIYDLLGSPRVIPTHQEHRRDRYGPSGGPSSRWEPVPEDMPQRAADPAAVRPDLGVERSERNHQGEGDAGGVCHVVSRGGHRDTDLRRGSARTRGG